MKARSVLSYSFKKILIATFIIIELAGFFFSTYRYISETKRIHKHHITHKISKESLNIRLNENRKDSFLQFSLFSLFLGIAGLSSYFLYQKQLKKVEKDFEIFTNNISSSMITHTPLNLENINYIELKNIAKSLNNVLLEIYNKDNYNSLTKMPNKSKFLKDILKLKNETELPIIIAYIYLKDYENLLKSRSFELVDKVIIELANRFSNFATTISNSKVAKISGNGDFLLAFTCTDINNALDDMAIKLKECFSESINFGSDGIYEQQIGIGFSILDNENYSTLIDNTYKAALLASLNKNKNYCNFSLELAKQIKDDTKLEIDLKKAIENKDLEVFYQAKIGANDNLVKGAEALIRWKRDNKFENTERFIKIAEKSDLILKIEKFVISCVHKDQLFLQNKGIFIPISVNISARHLQNNQIIKFLQTNSKKYNINEKYIEIEITERYGLNDDSACVLNDIKNCGYMISIDDFGKDYSSLSYINSLPIDTIKIDKSFVDGLKAPKNEIMNKNSMAIIEGIIKIAKSMNKKTTAEGVETIEQINYLKQIGCDELQGFYFYKGACPINEFYNFYKDKFTV
ncbi:GGDEF domain-containing phosphodiesterase [Campylobacter sp. MG1]|uniref:GGDEF domain-containing phosphodiesterase n=1 Tax=Campylobacter sp. MG1 TaxID=2976332 RepID=UPI00226CB1C7|nr:GGDEF domain-containing phosphodiesterase [Campylobacter sp. MG1]